VQQANLDSKFARLRYNLLVGVFQQGEAMGEASDQLIVEDILALTFPMMSLRLLRAGMIRGYLHSHSAVKIGITAIQGEEFDSYMRSSCWRPRRSPIGPECRLLPDSITSGIEGQADIARTLQIGRL